MQAMQKRKVGRPGKWSDKLEERAYRLCLLGLTDEDLALAFGINDATLGFWKQDNPALLKAIQQGRKEADGKVAQSLYHKALGYSHPDVHIAVCDGRVVKTPITKYYPPDTTACIFWLKNRQRENWRDVYRMEQTGANGGPIKHEMTINLSDFSDQELEMMEKMGLKLSPDDKENQNLLSQRIHKSLQQPPSS